ncbi:uncharacterized protein B0T15DRAFT_512988 [Chaetomium strumarium]|uniref:Uncharacterized protein n=1 Tax=Chaetomium strumarium TaxID=1170767 RepID=A0AAJ0GS66_9PEZI|nr:hypothetical protein B0T15DRAFT_512988 [Chaetomium strumarium]
MTAPRHRFIPFAFQDELAQQLAAQTLVLGGGSLYIYDLPQSYEARDLNEKQMPHSLNMSTKEMDLEDGCFATTFERKYYHRGGVSIEEFTTRSKPHRLPRSLMYLYSERNAL